ncbi:MAG TPA: signal peptide peptidase SppA, partial [Flavobacteriaceae bacterium]|nr:signal peptide peptidase SppA [Flavobacteriaceae bacterium]
IDYAATDDNIEGISIEVPPVQAGITQLKNIREALKRFKESGKFVTAYGNVYSQSDYYLSAVADSIFISPAGYLDFKGLATELMYTKDFQDKSGVNMEVVRMGKYKSAVEPFLQNEMSENNREQILSYLNSIWKNLRVDIGQDRDISAEHLDTIADQLLARTPEKAKNVGLIDKIAYRGEYESGLKKQLDIAEKKDLKFVNILDYSENIGAQNIYKSNNNKIAVIYAQGEIIDGQGTVSKVGPEEINKALRKARKNNKVKAVVFRINSPGGSAMASEHIWKEIENTKKEKPVIVSMGNLAASGGYYIAAGADRIFAEPSTITGSIGVFGMLPNFKELTDKIGLHSQQVKTNEHAITYSPFKKMNQDQHDFILENIQEIYTLFKTRVAEGRDLTMDQVEEIAQGRVWTGEQALDIGLVDELGSFQDALAYAAQQADIDEYQVTEHPIFRVDIDKILRQFGLETSKTEITKEILGDELYPIFEEMKAKTERKGIQLIFPYPTEIK